MVKMNMKLLQVLLLFLLLAGISYSKDMKTILNSNLNTRAVGLEKDEIWKKISFSLPYETEAKITVIATANDNGSRDDDDIKWAIDKTNFGWATENAWDGRETKGKKKKVIITKKISAGNHNLFFWADQNPILNSVKIEIEEKINIKTPEIKEIIYLSGIGMKITWENIKSIKEYQVYRKIKGEKKYNRIGVTNLPAYIDMKVNKNVVYIYKIGVVNKKGKIELYTKERETIIKKELEIPEEIELINKKDIIEFSWKNPDDLEIISYNIYRKQKNKNKIKKYSLSIENYFQDNNVEENEVYIYQITSINIDGEESEKSEEIEIKVEPKNYRPTGIVDIFPKNFVPGDKVRIYFSAISSKELLNYRKKSRRRDKSIKELPEKVYVHYGYNNWTLEYTILELDDVEMIYNTENKYWELEIEIPDYAQDLDMVFKDELDNWDTNWSRDYKFDAKKDLTVPKKIEEINVITKNSLVYLEWNKSIDKDFFHYKVFRSNSKENFEEQAESDGKRIFDETYIDKNLVGGKEYYYAIKVYDFSENESVFSKIVKAIPKKTGVLMKRKCEWEPINPSQGEIVRIYYSSKLGRLREKDIYAKLNFNFTEENGKKLIKMKKDNIFDAWYFEHKILPGNETLNVSFTNKMGWDTNMGLNWTITVKKDEIPPKKVSDLKTVIKLSEVSFAWAKNTEKDLAGYNVYRDNKKINAKLLKNVKFIDSEIQNGKKYIYAITAIDYNKNESEKNKVELTTLEDLINTPPERVYVTSIRKGIIRLIASIDRISKWRIDILNSKNEIIRSFDGVGSNMIVGWNFKDNKGRMVKPGKYKYRITILDDKTVYPKEVKMQILE